MERRRSGFGSEMANGRVAALVALVAGAACGGGGRCTEPRDAAAEGSGPSLDERITALGAHEYLVISTGDADGDGRPEIVVSAADTAPAARSSALRAAQGQANPVLARTSGLVNDDPTAIVFKSDAAGLSILAAQSPGFDLARVATVAVVRGAQASVAALQETMRNPETCALTTRLVETFSIGAQYALTAVESATVVDLAVVDFLGALLGAKIDDSSRTPSFLACLAEAKQTPGGCFAIMASRLLAETCGADPTGTLCKYFGSGDHCYQVEVGTSGTSCEGGNHPRSPLCQVADPSGCCNAGFVFNQVLPANVQNVAPMPLEPKAGPITRDDGFDVILDGPPLDILVEGLTKSGTHYPTLSCLFSGVLATRNPIKITLDRTNLCATNRTQPGHMLDGSVVQCIEEQGEAVTSNITGRGGSDDARLAYLNNQVGPLILATVREKLRASVTAALAEINQRGLCCNREKLLGGTAVPQADGTLAFTSSGPPGSACTAPAAGGPDSTSKVVGMLTHGQTLSYTFAANAGNGVQIRATRTSGNIVPTFQVHDPSGAVVAGGSGASLIVTGADFVTKTGGTFTVDVYDQTTVATASGGFTLVVAVAPGANGGGALTPGRVKTSQLGQGALDSYTFAAGGGQAVQLRLALKEGATFGASFTVYDPSGAVAATSSSASALVAGADFSAKTGGVYTVILSDGTTGRAGAGPYDLFLALGAAVNAGTPLVPGVPAAAVLLRGGLDVYRFDAQEGQAVQLRVAEQTGAAFTSTFAVYGPTGALVASGQTSSVIVSGADFGIKTSGAHTVVVYDGSTGRAGSGPYILYFVRAPGTAGTTLAPGAVVSGQLAAGALDAYTFAAQAGKTIGVHPAGPNGTAFSFTIAVYDPSGKLAGSANYGPVTFAAPISGTFTIVVYDGTTGRARTGPYTLSFTSN